MYIFLADSKMDSTLLSSSFIKNENIDDEVEGLKSEVTKLLSTLEQKIPVVSGNDVKDMRGKITSIISQLEEKFPSQPESKGQDPNNSCEHPDGTIFI